MYEYHYYVLAAFCCLLFNKNTHKASLVFLLGWFFYVVIIEPLDGNKYYLGCGFVELTIGYVLNKNYRAVSYLSYCLIIVNYIGWCLYHFGQDPFIYDTIYAIVTIAQLLILFLRGMADGLLHRYRGNTIQRLLLFCVCFDSRKARVRM